MLNPTSSQIHQRPKRLTQVFQSVGYPLYFVTFCTFDRLPRLANAVVLAAIHQSSKKLESVGNALGRFVIMPDHVHGFIRIGPVGNLSMAVRCLKSQITRALRESGRIESGNPLWQPGFFDYLLRSDESYAEKWAYVRDNPVRKQLVADANDWPYQGEITRIDRA